MFLKFCLDYNDFIFMLHHVQTLLNTNLPLRTCQSDQTFYDYHAPKAPDALLGNKFHQSPHGILNMLIKNINI